MNDFEKVQAFLDMAIDQELQAIGEDTRDDVPWADLLEGARFDGLRLSLSDGSGFRIALVHIDKTAMLRIKLGEVREAILKFTMDDVQAYCLDPERKKKWGQVVRTLYAPLHKIMKDDAQIEDHEAAYVEGVDLLNKIQAKADELDIVNIARGLSSL
jgi:hypothetical protein